MNGGGERCERSRWYLEAEAAFFTQRRKVKSHCLVRPLIDPNQGTGTRSRMRYHVENVLGTEASG